MQFPDFFASAPVIRMHDPLAEFLGAAKDDILAYRYADAVRLAGQYNRRNKLFFNQPLKEGSLRFARLDDDAAVEVGVDLSSLAGDPRMGELMSLCLSGQGTAANQQEFRMLWQERVRRLLVVHADEPQVIRIFR
jgi:hypothetical protein